MKNRGATLDIFLLPDREMAALKRSFLNKRTEPNVLAFPEPHHFPHPETKKKYLGEVYLNRKILRDDPARTAPLLLHGMLHLLGYRHDEEYAARVMKHIESKILAKIAVSL